MGRSKGPLKRAQRVVIYGAEGIGKSTFANFFPDPLFIDVEDGTGNLDIVRWEPRPTSWTEFKDTLKEIATAIDVGTIVIDTIDAVETLIMNHICATKQIDSIEDIGYGKGYTYLAEEMGKLLNFLTATKDKGYNIVILAHAFMRKFEQPDEMGSYDRWELKLQKKTAPLIKEWADMVLFANYETYVIEDEKTKSKKASGGKRVIYTNHHPCWDAKNRHGLPDKIPFDYKEIASFIPNIISEKYSGKLKELAQSDDIPPEDEIAEPNTEPEQEPEDENIPIELSQLMKRDTVSVEDIQGAVARQGYYPIDTPITNYENDFILGVLVAKWDSVKTNINNFKMKKGA